MKKVVLLISVFMVLVGCAGMDPQRQADMTANAINLGVIGAVTGCIGAEVFGGKCSQGAALLGAGGALLGIANTSSANTPVLIAPYERRQYYPRQASPYHSPYKRAYHREQERLRQQEYREWRQLQEERGRNDARSDFYGR